MTVHPTVRQMAWVRTLVLRAAALFLLAVLMAAVGSRASLAEDDIPDLAGKWRIKVGDEERELTLAQDGGKLTGKATRSDGKTSFDVSGSVDKTNAVTLKLYWDFAELESTSEEAWAAALDKRKDTQHPGLLRVEEDVKLSFVKDKDGVTQLLQGGLKRPKIIDQRDKETNKFIKLTDVTDEGLEAEITRQLFLLKSLQFSTADPDAPLKEGASWRPLRLTGELAQKAPDNVDPTVDVTVTNQRTKEKLSVVLRPRKSGAVEMVSGAIDVRRIGDPDGWSVSGTEYSVRVATKDVLRATSGKLQADLTIRDGADGVTAPELPGYRLIVGQTDVTFDPEERPPAPLEVKLVDGDGHGVPFQKIIWQLDGSDAETHPMTATDENGVARLEFMTSASGRFQPAYDGLPIGPEVPAGTLRVTAVPADTNIVVQLNTAAPTFQVTLNYPTIVKLLDASANERSFFIGAEERFVRVILGTRLAKLAPPSVAVDVLTKTEGGWVTVPEIRGGVGSFQVTANKTGRRGVYDSTDSVPIARALFRTKVSTVHLTVAGKETVFPAYQDRGTYSTEVARQVLDRLDEALAAAQRGPNLSDEGRSQLAGKAKMLGDAKSLFKEADGNIAAPAIRIAIAEAYSGLLMDTADPDELGDPAKVRISGLNKEYQFAHQAEGQRVAAAVDASLANLRAQLDGFIHAMEVAAIMAVAGPSADLYVAFSGRTIEGQRASTLERILAGTAGVSGLILMAAPIASYGRAELALERLQLAEERIIGRTLQNAMTSLPEFEISSAQVTQVLAKVPKLTDQTPAIAKSIARAEAESQNLATAEKELSHFQTKLTQANTELGNMKSELAKRIEAGITKNKTRMADIASKEGAIAQAKKSISIREKNIAAIKGRLAKIEAKMAEQRLERGLSKAELLAMSKEKRLPNFNDKVNGRSVASIYESQNAEVFKPYFPEKSFNQNQRMELPGTFIGSDAAKPNTRYAPTTWGVDFSVNPAKERAFMRPDLAVLDPETAELFECKYFVAEGGAAEEQWLEQLIPSVEKGRLAQYKLIREHRAALGQSLAFEDVWNDVLSRPLYVVTPREMSARFQSVLKASVRGAGKNVKFVVVPVPLEAWAATIPD